MLDWDDLRYFLAIHRGATFSSAARTLRVDQTTVGRRLASMEDALGARLFVRHPRGFALTPAGDAILPTAERVEEAMRSLERSVAGDDARLQGLVRVTSVEGIAQRVLVPGLCALRQAHPGICVEIVCEDRVADLARGQADIAVRIGTHTHEGLVATRVGEMAYGMYAAAEYLGRRGTPRHVRDLEGHDIVGYDESVGYRPAARWLDNVVSPGSFTFRGNTTSLVAAAAAAGMGLAVIPVYMGDTDPLLRRVGDELLAAPPIWLVLHRDSERLARIRVVHAAVEAAFRARAHLFDGSDSAML